MFTRRDRGIIEEMSTNVNPRHLGIKSNINVEIMVTKKIDINLVCVYCNTERDLFASKKRF